MLVLSRHPGQSVVIGGNVVVKVVSVEGNKVRLGFEAPVEIPIYRSELSRPVPAKSTEEEPCTTPKSRPE